MKEVVIGDATTTAELADLLAVRRSRVIESALQDLGRLATIHEELTFDQAQVIAARFGFVARRRVE
jgi:hypothetical protein